MDETGKGLLADRSATNKDVVRAMDFAVREALRDHKRAGNPVVVWRDGKMVTLSPDEIVIDEESDGAASGPTVPSESAGSVP